MSGARVPSMPYLPALDGLRAVSILLVVASHLGLGRIVPGGLGVTIFFFISGFIITRMLRWEFAGTGDISLKGFYVRRFFRLGPALLVYIALTAALFALLGVPLPLVDVLASVFYLANYHGMFHGWGGGAALPPLQIVWSLAIEEHFYFAFPLLLYACRHRPARLLKGLALLCVAVLGWRLYLAHAVGIEQLAPDRLYKSTDTRIDSIVFGCMLAIGLDLARPDGTDRWDRVVRRLGSPAALVAGALLMLGTLLYRDEVFRQSWRYSLQGLALVPWFIHLFATDRRDAIYRLVGSRPMVFVGKISYSLYLYHWLALCVLMQLSATHPAFTLVQVRLLCVPLMLVLAIASYRGIEIPWRAHGHRIAARWAMAG